MSGVSYPPPTSIIPIFNPSVFPTENEPLFQGQANNLYVQTGTANQTVKGTKTYDNLGMTATSPFTWKNGLATINLSPQLPIWSTTFRLPLYSTNTLDDIVARTATQTLTNKTLDSLKVGTNGTTHTLIQSGIVSQGFDASGQWTITFPTPFAAGTTPVISAQYSRGSTGFAWFIQVYARDRFGFSYRATANTVANPSQCFVAGDSHTLDWIAMGTA